MRALRDDLLDREPLAAGSGLSLLGAAASRVGTSGTSSATSACSAHPGRSPQGVAPMGNGASTASRTKLAEPYPRRFCVLRAQALAQDAAGWICYRGFWASVGVL